MKYALWIVVAAVALPVMAEEKSKQTASTEAKTTATAETTKAQAADAPQADSPLVAASKRANRLGKKPTNVITNETLKQSGAGAHVTTTSQQPRFQAPEYVPPPRPTPEMEAAARRAVEDKARAKKAAEQQKAAEAEQARRAGAAAAADDGYYTEEAEYADPTSEEGTVPQQKPPLN
jgi:hypothetical protein